MARIRTIKPEFFKHEAIFDAEKAECLPLRVAFSGLWCVADREGRFRWRPRALKLDVLPYDDLDFGEVLDALERHGFVISYEVDGEKYGYIPGFRRHQIINNREGDSSIPAPDGECLTRTPRVTTPTSSDPQSTGFVYVAVAPLASKAKIGFCVRNPKDRLFDLSCGSPEELELAGFFEGSQLDEARLRADLSGRLTRREWINFDDDAWSEIDDWVTREGRVKHAWGTRISSARGEGKGKDKKDSPPSVTETLSPTETKSPTQTPPSGGNGHDKPKPEERGKRLAEDWEPSETAVAYCRNELGATAGILNREYQAFMDWGLSATGPPSRKRNWDRAFVNWIRRVMNGIREQEDRERRWAERRAATR